MNIIDIDINEFCMLCGDSMPFPEQFKQQAAKCIKYYKAPNANREWLRTYQVIENRWYQSIANGNADYSIYNDWLFLPEAWACWTVYSKKYIKSIQKLNLSQWHVKSILDLGNGLGLTTLALADLFGCSATGTNIVNSQQWRINEKLGVKIQEDMQGPSDLIFASEFFEHLINPISYLLQILNTCIPKYIIVANAFSAKSAGHFDFYEDNIPNKKIGKVFNTTLRQYGYAQVKTGFWNNRPVVWAHNDYAEDLLSCQ